MHFKAVDGSTLPKGVTSGYPSSDLIGRYLGRYSNYFYGITDKHSYFIQQRSESQALTTEVEVEFR